MPYMSNLTKQKMFGGVLWSAAGKLLSMGSNMVVMLILARAIAPSDYGAYFVALTTIVILGSFGTLGMDQVVIRFLGPAAALGSRAGLRQTVGRCLVVVVATTLLVCLAFWWLTPFFFGQLLGVPVLATYAGLLAVFLFFATLQRQLAETFRGLNDLRMATLFGGARTSGIVNSVLICLVSVMLWAAGRLTLWTALITVSGASAVVVIAAASVLWWRLTQGSHDDRAIPVQSLSFPGAIHEGWPLWLAGIITVLNNTGSAWLASALDTASHVALFGVAQRFVLLLITPMVVINAILPPIIVQLHGADQLRRMERIIKLMGGMVLLPSLILLALLAVAGRPLLHSLFGAYYQAAYPLMIILCVGQVINIATGAWQIVLPMTGNKRQILTTSVLALVTQFGVGVSLGYRMGVLGVAIGFCVSTVITNLVGMLLVHRKLGIWTCASLDWQSVRDARELILAPSPGRRSWQKS